MDFIGKILDMTAKASRDDGKSHVNKAEEWRKFQQEHIQVRGIQIFLFGLQMIEFSYANHQNNDSNEVDGRVGHFRNVFGLSLHMLISQKAKK